MADIELVIKIPEEIYHMVMNTGTYGMYRFNSTKAIAKGTPLPKGHGKLVDLDQMCEDYWDGNYMEIHEDDLPNIKPIIEADRKEQ